MIHDLTAHQEKFSCFRVLWKSDDEAWLEQREFDWDVVRQKYEARYIPWSEDERRYFSRFFLYGEETVEDLLSRKPGYRILFTPYEDEQQASLLYKLFTHRDLLSAHADVECHVYDGSPIVRKRVSSYLAGSWGADYDVWLEKMDRWERASLDTRGARDRWVEGFAMQSWRWLTGDNPIDYYYTVDCVPFLMSVLHCKDRLGESVGKRFTTLIATVIQLSRKNQVSDLRRELLEKLLIQFTADVTPAVLRRAYLDSKEQERAQGE